MGGANTLRVRIMLNRSTKPVTPATIAVTFVAPITPSNGTIMRYSPNGKISGRLRAR